MRELMVPYLEARQPIGSGVEVMDEDTDQDVKKNVEDDAKGRIQLSFVAFIIFLLLVAIAVLLYASHRL